MDYKNDPLIEQLNKTKLDTKTFFLLTFLGGLLMGILVANC